MRILHLATSLSGGAGIAARRICEAQRDAGLDSRILGGGISSGSKLKSNEEILEISKKSALLSSLNTVIQSTLIQKDDRLVTSISIDQPALKEINFADFNVVHLHAFYNLLNYKSIIKFSKNLPLVITMHDQRFFTGGCHYSFDCTKYEVSCEKCPQTRKALDFIPRKTLSKNFKLLSETKNITFISPSIWLMNRAKTSKLVSSFNHRQIYNPIPGVYTQIESRNQPGETLNIGFISQNLNNPYKGFMVLLEAIRKVESKRRIHLHVFGSGKFEQKFLNTEVTQINFDNDSSATNAYNSCDLIIVPSVQDNLPSVVSESLMCGVPVIGSNVGGIGEILKIFNLPTFEPGDIPSLAKLIQDFDYPLSSRELSQKARSHFSYEASAATHIETYTEAIRNHTDPA